MHDLRFVIAETLADGGPVDDEYDATDAVLDALTAAGYRIIQTDQAEHGDALERVDHVWHDPKYPGAEGLCYLDFSDALGEVFARRPVGNEQDTP
jgi:hypothetical protein